LHSHYSSKGQIDNVKLRSNGVIRLRIPYLGLASGKWKISIGIFDKDYIKPFAWEWFIAELDVIESEEDNMHGRFRMPHHWLIN